MSKRNLNNFILRIFFVLTIFKLTAGRTVTHYEIITKPNGDQIRRSWTTEESDEAGESAPASDKSFRKLQPFETDKDFTEMIKDAARSKGMDPESIAKLLRTKTPVVKVTIDPKTGHKHTTTYRLEPSDGMGTISIKSNTVVKIPTVVDMPQEHPYAPMGGMIPITRTYVNMEGKPVRETYGVPRRIRPVDVEEFPVQIGSPWRPPTMPSNTNEYYPRNPDPWRMPLIPYNVRLSPNNPPRKDVSEEDFWPDPDSEPMEYPENQREKPTRPDLKNGRDDNNSKMPKVPTKPLKQLVEDLYKTTTTSTTARPTTTTTNKTKITSTQKPLTTTTTKKTKTPPTTRKLATTEKPTTTTTPTTRPATTTQESDTTVKTLMKNPTTTPNPPSTQETSSTSENPAKNDKCITNDDDDANDNDDRNVIVKYLSKVGLTVDDVVSKKHQTLTKTIIDNDGNILTATYMLSSVKGHDAKPIK